MSRGLAVRILALASLVLVAGCATPFPSGWVYVTRVDRTAATVVWTGADARVACRSAADPAIEGAVARLSHGVFAARVEGLRSNTRYACRIVAPDGGRVAQVRFRTAPDDDEPFLFAVVGDSGHGGIIARALARRIRAAHPAFLVHVGDFAYVHGTAEDYGRTFFPVYRTLLRQVPLFPTPGNHDLYHSSIYRALFAPAMSGRDDDGLRYHFTWGLASFVSLSAHDGAMGAPGLAQELAADRPRPWRIVFLHEPLYTAGSKRVEPGLRAGLEPVVEAAGVDLVLAGHEHFYERSLASCEFVPTARVFHITSGGGGGVQLDHVRPHPNFPSAASLPHFLRIRVTSDWIDVRAVGPHGHTIDRWRRVRNVDPGCRAAGWPRQRGRKK